MKMYEKPMAIVEKIEVEDVILASIVSNKALTDAISADAKVAADNTIIFNW